MGRDEDLKAIGERDADTSGVVSATSCVPKTFPCGHLETESSGGMDPSYPQAPPPSFGRQRIGKFISVDGVVQPSCVEEIDFWFEDERRSWGRRVQDLEEEVRRLMCEGK